MLLDLFTLLQTTYPDPYGANYNPYSGMPAWMWIVFAIIAILTIAGMWKAFQKAGEPGWASIIPIYNVYVLTKIAKKPWWWLLLLLIPLVNIVINIMLYIAFAKQYGKGAGYGLGLAFLPFIFWPMLGFGDAQYEGHGLQTDIDNIGSEGNKYYR